MTLDPRVTPARADLAAAHLAGQVEAPRYAEGRPHRVVTAVCPVRRAPDSGAPLDTEALRGERVAVYEMRRGWAWGQIEGDGYVGYFPSAALGRDDGEPTHRVSALRTFLFPAPAIKAPTHEYLSMGARVRELARDGGFVRVTGGFLFAGHLSRIDEFAPDFVAEALRLLGAPYLWGGKSSLGLDCSGLVQLAMDAAGRPAPRDSDMQQAALGAPVEFDESLAGLARGDLAFWRGHVGVMLDAHEMLHANAFHMAVAREPLRAARDRILDRGGGPILAVRRP